MIDRTQLHGQLVDAGLSRVADELVRLVRPSIRIETTRCDEDAIPLGVSKFGGLPHVPEDFMWPRWKDEPLAFVGQINLSTIARNPTAAMLPSTGLLSFFYNRAPFAWGFDPADKGSWRVYLLLDDSLRRAKPPTPMPSGLNYAPCELSFQDRSTHPTSESLYVQALDLTTEEDGRYNDFLPEPFTGDADHRLLGHPQELQAEMQLKCQFASNGIYCGCGDEFEDPRAEELASGASEWMLLLQCDSDEAVGFEWCDIGRLFYWIKQSDLEAQRFDRVWMMLQC